MTRTRIVYIGDLHLGRCQYGSDAGRDDVLGAFERAVGLDGLALGGLHQQRSGCVHGTDIWYASATGQFGTDDGEAGVVRLLEIGGGTTTQQQLELWTRPFVAPDCTFGGSDGVTVSQARDAGAAVVDVDDGRGHTDCPVEQRATEVLRMAQNAVETAALRGFNADRVGESVPAAQNGRDGTGRRDNASERIRQTGGDADKRERETDEGRSNDMTDEREELISERDRYDAKLSELGTAIDEIRSEINAIDDDLTGAITERDTRTEAFLPDDEVPDTVSNETRGAIGSHLDALAEKRDVKAEKVAMRNEALKIETKYAADARDDIDDIEPVVEDLVDRTDEAESKVDDAREELDAVRSQFEDDLAEVAVHLATFEIDLSEGTLGNVNEVIPERDAMIRASIESANDRIGELSRRQSRLEADRDKLRSIEGEGTCPTCDQNVGPERTDSEVKTIEVELNDVQRQLGTAEQERDELIARREELTDLRDEVVALRSFRSETVAEAAGRVEDRQENFEDLQADLEEERTELAEAKEAREKAEAAIATLEIEIDDFEAEIDSVESQIREGERILKAFRAVDELRAKLDEKVGEITALQEEYAEMETEREAIAAVIEETTDGE